MSSIAKRNKGRFLEEKKKKKKKREENWKTKRKKKVKTIAYAVAGDFNGVHKGLSGNHGPISQRYVAEDRLFANVAGLAEVTVLKHSPVTNLAGGKILKEDTQLCHRRDCLS